MSEKETIKPSGNIIDLHPSNVDAPAVLAIASKAARCAEEASQKATMAFDESRRARKDIKALTVSQAKLSADMADNQAAIINALHAMAQSDAQQAVLAKQVQQAEFNARAARSDAVAAEEKSEEVTGRYNLAELARQSKSDEIDREIVQAAAQRFITTEEQDRLQKNKDSAAKRAFFWKLAKQASVIIIAVVTSLLATKYGIAVPTQTIDHAMVPVTPAIPPPSPVETPK